MMDLAVNLWPILAWIFVASCKSTIVIALVFLCRRLFAPWFSARDRHRLWFAVIACLILPFGPQVEMPLGSWSTIVSETPRSDIGLSTRPYVALDQNAGLENLRIPNQNLPPTHSSEIEAPQITVGLPSLLGAVWLGVATLLFAFTQWNLIRYFRIKSRAREVGAATTQLFLQCKAELGLRRDVRLLETSQMSSPAIFGWWSPTLLLPPNLSDELRASELRHVFLHELSHVQRNDILVNWLTTVVQIVHWFNPLVWYVLRVMRDDMEQACDSRVVSRWPSDERMNYGQTLIRLADFYPKRMSLAHGAGIVESHSQLKARIKMIAQVNPERIMRPALSALVLIAMTSTAVTQPRTESAAPDNSTTTPTSQLEAVRLQLLTKREQLAMTSADSKSVSVADTMMKHNQNEKAKDPTNQVIAKPVSVVAASKELATEEPLRTEYRRLNYTKAYDIAVLIKPVDGASLLSGRGSLIVDERTNTLVLRDTAERLADIQRVLEVLDIPVQRIQLSVRILVVDSDLRRDLISEAVPTGLNVPRTLSGAVTIPPINKNFDAQLSTALDSGRAEIVAAPRLITFNGKEAMIQQGIEFPPQELPENTSANEAPAKSRSMVLTLKVTPKVAANKRIDLDLDALIYDVDSSEKGETRRIVTKAEMNDSYTVVLDGLLLVEKRDGHSQATPVKGLESHRQLLVLLTPTLLPKQEPLYPAAL